jgi:hypothetical protein
MNKSAFFVLGWDYFFGGGSVGHAGRRTSSSPRTGRIPESIVGVLTAGGGGIGGAAIGAAWEVAIGTSVGDRMVAKPRSGRDGCFGAGVLVCVAVVCSTGRGAGLDVFSAAVESRPTATPALSVGSFRSNGVLVTGAFGPGSGRVSLTVGNARQCV